MTDSRMWYYDPETDQWGLLPAGGGGQGAGAPIGTVVSYVGSEAPEGWHLCDGSPHGSAPLEALIGSPNTPDLRGRFLLGASAGHPAKQTGGAETHTLTAAEMPVHNHAMGSEAQEHIHPGTTGLMDRAAVHAHGVVGSNVGGTASATLAAGGSYWAPVGNVAGMEIAAANTDHAHAFNTGGRSAAHIHGVQNTGGGGAHNNMPPFYAIVYIIKTFTDAVVGDGFTREEALAQFVNVTGDTMTGPLTVPEPVEDAHAATKGYVDRGLGGAVLSGHRATASGILTWDRGAKCATPGWAVEPAGGHITIPEPGHYRITLLVSAGPPSSYSIQFWNGSAWAAFWFAMGVTGGFSAVVAIGQVAPISVHLHAGGPLAVDGAASMFSIERAW